MYSISIGGKKMKKHSQIRSEATVAPGIDDDQGLEIKASPKDLQEGNTTKVTSLSLDENDPS